MNDEHTPARPLFIVHRSSFIVHRFCPGVRMSLLTTLSSELDQMSSAGTLKHELRLKGPQGPVVEVEGKGEVIMLTSNNYLGLADHPAIIEAAAKGGRDRSE